MRKSHFISFVTFLFLTVFYASGQTGHILNSTSSTFSCNQYLNSSPLDRSSGFGEEQVINGNYQGVAQQYNGLSGQLKAVLFRGRVNPLSGASTNTVKVVVYNANLGYPGTIIGSQNVVVNASATNYDVLATFSSPLTVNGDVIISVEPFSPLTDDFFIQRNAPPDGQFLNLIKIKQANQWFKNLAAGDPDFDFDFMILPVSAVSVTASFNANTSLNVTTFTNTSVNATSYEWDFGDGSGSQSTSPTHNYASSGLYNVKLKAYRNGIDLCVDSVITPINVLLTSIQEPGANTTGITLSGNLITDEIVAETEHNLDVKIIDSSGNEVQRVRLQKNIKNVIDVRNLNSGIYYIYVSPGHKLKFIKLKN